LIYLPNNVITAIYTVSHQKKNLPKYTLLKNFFSFTDNKTGAIGIDIKFSATTADDYQLIAYATFPKVAVIDNTGSCQLVDA
jgi:hypothetical protein